MGSYWHAALATETLSLCGWDWSMYSAVASRGRYVRVSSFPTRFQLQAGGTRSIPRVHVFLLNGTVTFQPLCEFALHLLQPRGVGVTWVSRKRPNVALPLFTLFAVANCVGERTVIMWGFCSSLNPSQSCVAERFSLSRKKPFNLTLPDDLLNYANGQFECKVIRFCSKLFHTQKNATKEVAKARNCFNCHWKQ